MVTTASAQGSGKLTGKDFIFIAIFGVLVFVMFLAVAMVMSMNVGIYWFYHCIAAIPAGIVWMYLLARVPKRGAVLAMSLLAAVIGLLFGMFWAELAGIVVGGVLGELIASAGKRSTARDVIAFAAFTFCFWLGQQLMVFFAGGAYVDMVMASGMSVEYGQALVDFTHGPLVVAAGIGAIVGPLIGGVLGAQIFKKHFARIAA